MQLLEEIRDLQRDWIRESRERIEASILLQEEAVERQKAIGAFYKKVVFAGAVIVAGLLVLLIFMFQGIG